jgi:hypothetical protein
MKSTTKLVALAALICAPSAWAAPVFTTFEAVSLGAAGLTPTVDAFRAAISGPRREINWDGVPDTRADPNALPADFFNATSPRGVVFSTPGTGFLVSANAGLPTPTLFGFGSDFAAFSAQRLFTAVDSNITDVRFYEPGTLNPATTSAFGVVFTDVEVADLTQLEFFDAADVLIYSRYVQPGGNQGFSFLGATVTDGSVGRVRITAGLNTIRANGQLGNPNDDVVVMDDFIYAEPTRTHDVPEPSGLALAGLALMGALIGSLRRRGKSVRQSGDPFNMRP